MPKIKMPKSSPSIDMTPMVDLAFLLVTFFMLSANFRESEPVNVTTPSSTADVIIPKNIIMVTIDQGGHLFFNISGLDVRRDLLLAMGDKYHVKFTQDEVKSFSIMTSFGAAMKEMPKYIDMTADERKRMVEVPGYVGVPADTTKANELRDWLSLGNGLAMEYGKANYEEALTKDKNALADDFKPKFILKVDSKAPYIYAKNAIDVFRDLNLNNLNFVTNFEERPKE